jgi:hypothetical protein
MWATLDPDSHSSEKVDPISPSPERLDPDQHKMNADPKHCSHSICLIYDLFDWHKFH